MKLIKWRLGGIGAVREDLEIPVAGLGDARLVAVCGVNGAGKTTALETVPGALYGDTPSRGSLARLANRRDSFVELGMEVGGNTLEARVLINGVVKTPKTEAYLAADGEPVSSGKGRDFKAAVASRFPSQDVYLASGFAAQGGGREGAKRAFLDLPKTDRKALFLEMLGAGRVELLAKAAGDHHADVLGALKAKRAAVDGALALAGDVPTLETAATRAQLAADDAQLEVGRLELDAKALASALDGWRDLQATLERRRLVAGETLAAGRSLLADAETRVQQLQAEVDRVARERAEAVARLAGRGALAQVAAGLVAGRARVAEAEASIEALRQLELRHQLELAAWAAKRADAEALYREAKAQWLAAKTQAQAAHVEAQNLWDAGRHQASAGLKRAASEVELLTAAAGKLDQVPCGGDGEFAGCPLITAAVAASHKLRAAQVSLEQARGLVAVAGVRPPSVVDAETAVEVLAAEPRAVVNAVAAGRALGDAPVAPDLSAAPGLRASLLAAQDDVAEALAAGAKVDALTSVEAQVEQLEAAGLRALSELEPALAEVPPLRAQVADAETGRTFADLEIERHAAGRPAAVNDTGLLVARDRGRRLEGEAAAAQERLAAGRRASETVAGALAEISALTLELDDWAELRRAFGRDGIQALEISAAAPEVSELINELFRGAYGSRFTASLETVGLLADGSGQKEIFDLRVIDSEAGTDGSASNLSGGEKVIVAEALSLAIAVFNARRSEIAIEDIFRDEAAGALSHGHAVRYIEMLRRALDLGGFHRIWFVAHQPHLWPLADARLYFDGQGGCRIVDEVPMEDAS